MSLLAEQSNTHVRTRVLYTEDELYSVRARAYYEPELTVLETSTKLGSLGYFISMVDSERNLLAFVCDYTEDGARKLAHAELERKGIKLTTHFVGLMAEHSNGRRTSVLHTDDDELSIRAKVHYDDDGEGALIRIRAYVAPEGYIHIVVDDRGRLAAFVTGGTDADAYERVKGELKRRGYDLT